MSQTVICQIQPYAALKTRMLGLCSSPDVGFMLGLSPNPRKDVYCSIVVENSFKTMKAVA